MEIKVAIPVEIPPYWYQVDSPVILDKTITPQAKVVYAVISGLTRSSGECWASNEYISKLLGISKHTVSRCISELKDAGHILSIVQDNYRRTITLPYSRVSQKPQWGLPNLAKGLAKNAEGVSQKPQDNIKNELDELNNINKDTNTSVAPQPCEQYQQNTFDFYVSKWNEFMDSKVIKLSEGRKKKLNARIKNDVDFDKHFEICLYKIKDSNFLSGRKGGWKATFDWIIENDTNYVKVLEDAYKNKEGGNNGNSKFEQTLNAAREYAKEHGLV